MQQNEAETTGKQLLLGAFPELPEEVEFDFELPGGGTVHIRARSLRDSSEGDQLYRRASEICDVIEKGAVPPQWKQWLPCTQNVAQFCFYISELLLEPEVTMPEALEWAKTRHPLVPTLGLELIKRVVSPVQAAEFQRIDSEKKDSVPTPTPEHS